MRQQAKERLEQDTSEANMAISAANAALQQTREHAGTYNDLDGLKRAEEAIAGQPDLVKQATTKLIPRSIPQNKRYLYAYQ